MKPVLLLSIVAVLASAGCRAPDESRFTEETFPGEASKTWSSSWDLGPRSGPPVDPGEARQALPEAAGNPEP